MLGLSPDHKSNRFRAELLRFSLSELDRPIKENFLLYII